jgi:hypothetical protein
MSLSAQPHHRLQERPGTLIASASPAYKGDGSKADPEDLLVARFPPVIC